MNSVSLRKALDGSDATRPSRPTDDHDYGICDQTNVGSVSALDSLADEDGHPIASRHNLIIMTRRFAYDVCNRVPVFVGDEQALDAFADMQPDASVVNKGCRDFDRFGLDRFPVPALDRGKPGPTGARKRSALPASVPPAREFQSAVSSDGDLRGQVIGKKPILTLTVAVVDPSA